MHFSPQKLVIGPLHPLSRVCLLKSALRNTLLRCRNCNKILKWIYCGLVCNVTVSRNSEQNFRLGRPQTRQHGVLNYSILAGCCLKPPNICSQPQVKKGLGLLLPPFLFHNMFPFKLIWSYTFLYSAVRKYCWFSHYSLKQYFATCFLNYEPTVGELTFMSSRFASCAVSWTLFVETLRWCQRCWLRWCQDRRMLQTTNYYRQDAPNCLRTNSFKCIYKNSISDPQKSRSNMIPTFLFLRSWTGLAGPCSRG